ncbi:MAG: M48 family metalloprotease [Planctomycetota bacterium]
MTTPTHALAMLLLCFAIDLVAGRRQAVEAGASRLRYYGRSLLLAFLQSLPLTLHVLCVNLVPVLSRGLSDEEFYRLWENLPIDPWKAGFLSLALLGWGATSLRPVAGSYRHGIELEPMTDPDVLARVTRLARRVGVPTPRVLLMPTGGRQATFAFVGGFYGPTMLLADGIFDRLDPAEADAILAHELGHVRQHTIGKQFTLLIAAGLIAFVLGAWLGFVATVVLAGALFGQSIRWLGHWEEPRCDLRGARAVGFGPTARALGKIHAVHRLFRSPAMRRWFHAVMAHPGLEVREDRLWREAPAEERGALPHDPAEARRHCMVFWLCVVAFSAALVAGAWLGVEGGHDGAAILLMALPFLASLLLYGLAIADVRRRSKDRPPFRMTTTGIIGLLLFVAAAVELFNSIDSIEGGWKPLIALGVMMVGLLLPRMFGRGRRRLARAILAGRFDEAREQLGRLGARARKDTQVRFFAALLDWVAGRRDEARDGLRALLRDDPKYRPTSFVLAGLLRRVAPEEALAIYAALEQRGLHSPGLSTARAMAEVRAGRLDEADRRVQDGLEEDGDNAELHGAAAILALERGDVAAARRALAEAERLGPGSIGWLPIECRIQQAEGRPDEARATLARIRELHARNRLALLDEAIEELEDALDPAPR